MVQISIELEKDYLNLLGIDYIKAKKLKFYQV